MWILPNLCCNSNKKIFFYWINFFNNINLLGLGKILISIMTWKYFSLAWSFTSCDNAKLFYLEVPFSSNFSHAFSANVIVQSVFTIATRKQYILHELFHELSPIVVMQTFGFNYHKKTYFSCMKFFKNLYQLWLCNIFLTYASNE